MIIPAEKLAGQNSAYRHRKYEGRFRERRRPSLFHRGKRGLLLVPQRRMIATGGNVLARIIATVLSRLLFLAEFLECRIGAQRVPNRIEPKKRRRNSRWAVKPATIWGL